jgi:hypothetical protein
MLPLQNNFKSGTMKILNACKAVGLPEPEMEEQYRKVDEDKHSKP